MYGSPFGTGDDESLQSGFASSDDERFHFAPPKHRVKEYQIDPLKVGKALRIQTPISPKFDLSFHFSPDSFQVGVTTSFGYHLPRGNFKPDFNQTPVTQSWFNGSKTLSDLFGAIAILVIEQVMAWEGTRYLDREAHGAEKQGKL
ncbi:hypothetical protein Lmor_1015 [Legionella moravica]|uniref:Uncharacterized protein n=1 Tax=Legionella moravica TaxID=39962 RepID=A0A378JWA8_9GAMM|nr:hypothetical protein [Legionella moravica]KTD35568.1 hypothetical protein Lmor_1015 [Legionella moravica]STX62716.1 Uncharacterised protein [Legionella moravica]